MVYAPRQSKDRLLLGLKGSLNEYELDLLRQRSVEARREKARRGELLVTSPVGYRKGELRLEKDPDRRVQEAVALVFQKLGELGSVRQTLLWFLEHGLELPVTNAHEEVCWKRPSYGMIYSMLTNPAYGGTYAYGKTEHVTQYHGGEARQTIRRKPRNQWLSFIPGTHEGYVSWEEFEHLQATISENAMRCEHSGAAHRGVALLAGLLRCRRCGHKLVVHYTGNCHDVLRYGCRRGWLDNGEPRCISFAGLVVDQAISKEVLSVVQPAAIEAAVMAHEEQARKVNEVLTALQRALEAAQYSARRAQKQYDAADPENRLVTDELERRWNQSLQRVREIETQIQQHRDHQGPTAAPTREEFADLATELESLWHDPDTDTRLKKRVIRTLIRDIIVDVDAQVGEVILIIHWKGGIHTEVRLPRRRRGQNSTHTSTEVLEAVRVLAHTCSDRLIAGVLNRNGRLTGRGNRWTQERVTALRSYHHIPCYRAEQRDSEPWMNLTEAAKELGIGPRTLRLAVERGEIEAQHPLADGPWVFNREILQAAVATTLVERVTARNRHLAVPNTKQATFEFSST